ncbi:MAG TPA: succinate dehydrogenase cytochrome b subunit [Acidimicrobiales bacterium]|nr:succinate dehydrogenase cytochrome b subunit [Acidimicrobiales bacterium]
MPQATTQNVAPRPIGDRPTRPLPFPLNLYQTAVGKKWVMAITGIVLLGYVLVHMIGNTKLYYGVTSINDYGEWLRNLGDPLLARYQMLWIFRIGLIVVFALHIHSAYSLTRMNQRARPTGYQSQRDYIAADFASRTMRWTGVIVGLFVIFHLADLTIGTANPDFVQGDVYNNIVASFERVPVAAFYIVANLALGLHIYHGAWSIFQSLGLNNPRLNAIRRPFAIAFAVIVVAGNISFPIAVQLGLVDQENRTTPLAGSEEAEEADEALPGTITISLAEAAR